MTVTPLDRDRTLDLFALFHKSNRTTDELRSYLDCAPADVAIAISNLGYRQSEELEEWIHMAPRNHG